MSGLANNMLEVSKPEDGKITTVQCSTTVSPEPFTLEVKHSWSPVGAQRFVDLVKDDFFTDVALFRCVKNFLVQFGIPPDASSAKKAFWRQQGAIEDDPNLEIPFKRGMLSFAGGGPDSRTTQLFITFVDLPHLGKSPWETPFGVVTRGMDSVVDNFYQGYGDQQPFNEDGISQTMLQQRGNEYLRESFPKISYLKECHVVGEGDLSQEALMVAASGNKDSERQNEIGRMDLSGLSSAQKGGEGGVEDQSVSLPVFVFLALALGAVFVVWRKSKKDRRLVN